MNRIRFFNQFINENNKSKKYIVFHSSDEYFREFDLSKVTNLRGDLYGYGLYFTDNITYSKQFGKYTYRCEIILNNPLDLTTGVTKDMLLSLVENIDTTEDNILDLVGLINNGYYTTAFRYIRKYISFVELSSIFDGVIGYADGGGKEYVVYDQNNINILSIES